MVGEKLKETIDNMTEKEKQILLNALSTQGWVKLKVKNSRVVEGYTENRL